MCGLLRLVGTLQETPLLLWTGKATELVWESVHVDVCMNEYINAMVLRGGAQMIMLLWMVLTM